jgi:hypothetical protein
MNLINVFSKFSASQGTDSVRAGVRKEGNSVYFFRLFQFTKHMVLPLVLYCICVLVSQKCNYE